MSMLSEFQTNSNRHVHKFHLNMRGILYMVNDLLLSAGSSGCPSALLFSIQIWLFNPPNPPACRQIRQLGDTDDITIGSTDAPRHVRQAAY